MGSDVERWDLSAPASQVLLTGASTPPAWAVKLAFKELVLRRSLRLGNERRRRLLVLHRETDVLSVERWPAQGTERPLVGVMEAFPKAAVFRTDSGAVSIDVAAKEVRRWYRAGGGYVQAEVLPHLQFRGFYRVTETQRGKEWELTEAGRQKLAELRALLNAGQMDLPGWLRNDPARAAAYLTGAGATLLLLGNPVTWMWELMAEVLAGGTVAADGIPSGAGSPFVLVPEPLRPERDSEQEQRPSWSEESMVFEWESGHASEDAPVGGGGGFESPGQAIDAGFADADGDGDGGDGE